MKTRINKQLQEDIAESSTWLFNQEEIIGLEYGIPVDKSTNLLLALTRKQVSEVIYPEVIGTNEEDYW